MLIQKFLPLAVVASGLALPAHAQELSDDLAFLLGVGRDGQFYPQLPAPGREIPPVDWRITAPRAPDPTVTQQGPLTLHRALTAGAYFDDNVYASNGNRQSDWAYFLRPELGFTARGEQHALEGKAQVDVRRYHRFEDENQITGDVGLRGLYQPDRDTRIQGRVRYARGQESRGAGESLLTRFDKPVTYDQYEAAASLDRRFGRQWIALGAGASWVKYSTPTIAGTPVDQSYRDGTVTVISARAGYVVAPSTSVFLEWSGNRRDFEVDAFDSRGYRVTGGVLLEPGRDARLRGEAYFGYLNQNYVGETFETISTWTYGGSLTFQMLPKLTSTVLGSRDAKESALNGGGSLLESVAGIRFDYQINPQLSVGAGTIFSVQEFIGANRADRTWSPLASAKYVLTPNLTLAFDYRYLAFDSTGFGTLGYVRNVFLVALNGRM
jgi:hypothetical protein